MTSWKDSRPQSEECAAVLISQRAWAERRGVVLNQRGDALQSAGEAFFVNLDAETRSQFERGAGGEVRRMHSLRSSSTLAVNVFLPWKSDPTRLVRHLGWGNAGHGLGFEAQYPTGVRSRHPHLDVVMEASPLPIAIESKFLEIYDEPSPQTMSTSYLTNDGLWRGLNRTRELAEVIAVDGMLFTRLHAAQLIKHVLGLSRRYGARGFRLVYIWYRVPGVPAELHEAEIASFAERVGGEIEFVPLTYQDLFLRMVQVSEPVHGYHAYLGDRYFSDL